MTEESVIYYTRKTGSFEPMAWYNLIYHVREEILYVDMNDYWIPVNKELAKFQGHYTPGSGQVKFPNHESLLSFVLAWS